MAYKSITRLRGLQADIKKHAKKILVGELPPHVAQSAQKIKNLCGQLDQAIDDAEKEMREIED